MTTSWEDARSLAIEEGARNLTAVETVALASSAGRTLATDLLARNSVPHFPTAAMDGWVVAGEGPWSLGPPVETGDAPTGPLAPGTARSISTGGLVPEEATAVLRRERGTADGSELRLRDDAVALAAGADIRVPGDEVEVGHPVLASGMRLTPPALAFAAVSGIDEVPVRVRPAVDVIMLGSEVVDAGIPRPGQVRDAFGIQLPSLLEASGAAVGAVQRVADDEDLTVRALAESTAALLITTGGTGFGRSDHLATALERTGAEVLVRGVSMRPGHPTILARRESGFVVCLPGNPFAAMVALVSFGLPALRGMLGMPEPSAALVRVALDIPNPTTSTRLVACASTDLGVVPCASQGPSMLRGLVAAELLLLVPPGGSVAGQTGSGIRLPW